MINWFINMGEGILSAHGWRIFIIGMIICWLILEVYLIIDAKRLFPTKVIFGDFVLANIVIIGISALVTYLGMAVIQSLSSIDYNSIWYWLMDRWVNIVTYLLIVIGIISFKILIYEILKYRLQYGKK